jgi:hypothetical protein
MKLRDRIIESVEAPLTVNPKKGLNFEYLGRNWIVFRPHSGFWLCRLANSSIFQQFYFKIKVVKTL